jgi:hypothetical protein
VYYAPAPLVYAAPVYYQPAPVVYLPQPYYAPRRVVYATGWAPSRHGHAHGHWRDHGGKRGERGGPVMVGYGGR